MPPFACYHRTTRYLNTNGKFRLLCPSLLQRIVELGAAVDSAYFHLIDGGRAGQALSSKPECDKDQGQRDLCAADTARKARLTKLDSAGKIMSTLVDHGIALASLAPRCVEYHTMIGGAEGLASCGTDSLLGSSQESGSVPLRSAVKTAHYDQGSVLTVDIMLAETTGFEGGRLSTLEANGECKHHTFEQGDALVFVSHKYQ